MTEDNHEKESQPTEAHVPGITRRAIVGGMTTGLVAALAPGIAAQSTPQSTPQTVKRDPLTEYPKPPFPLQRQPWPGLQRDMTPRPDSGEESYRGTGRLKGRKALVTGGDSGIGRAAAIAFAREGADVAINYYPTEEPDAQEVIALIRKEGRKAVAIPGDIREEAFCSSLVDRAVRELGGLDILVNNAARQQYHESISELTTEAFDATLKTNFYALFWITKAALPHLSAGASIINTASEQAFEPSEFLLDYAPTKAAIVAFTKALAKQLAKQGKGIRVNAVAPGPFWTPLQISGGSPPDRQKTFGTEVPYGRPGQPAEIAPIYVFLASAESSYSSGQVVGAQGGKGVT